MAWYDTGTIAVTNGNATVTGTGTQFISGAQVGEAMLIDNVLYEIQSIVSATSITLADNYLAATQSGLTFKIVPTQSLVADLSASVTSLISDYSTIANNAGAGKFNDGTVTSPGIQFLQDSDNGLYRIGSNNWGLVAGGAKIVDVSTSGIDVTGDITLGDANPTITFEDSSVVNLNHTISSGSDNLRLTADVNGVDAGSRVEIFDGSTEVARFSAGAMLLTGTATMDGLSVVGTGKIGFNTTGTYTLNSVPSPDYGLGYTVSTNPMNLSGYYGLAFATARTERLKIASSGDISFYEDTGTTAKFFWDASAESLELTNSATSTALKVTKGNTTGNAVEIINSGASRSLDINHNADGTGTVDDVVRIKDNGTTKFVIDENYNVGIGTDSPDGGLDIEKTVNTAWSSALRANDFLQISNISTTGGSYSGIELIATGVGAAGAAEIVCIDSGSGSGDLAFSTRNNSVWSEKMRIDSSGNVGIGTSSPSFGLSVEKDNGSGYVALFRKSSSDPALTIQTTGGVTQLQGLNAGLNAVHGIALQSSGGNVGIGTSSPTSALTTNVTVDGAIHTFSKSDVAVGSIGYGGGGILYNAASNYGLKFYDAGGTAIIHPATTAGGDLNGSVDLGYSAARFKDLYLSSGVYLGGTGAANKLDDYEEGNFTPTVRGSSTAGTATYNIATGFYEKIGSLVHFQLYLDWAALNGTGNLLVTGLPFSASNDLNLYTAVSSYVSGVTLTANNVAQGFLLDRNSTNITCKQAPVGGGSASAIVVDGAGTILLSGTYRSA